MNKALKAATTSVNYSLLTPSLILMKWIFMIRLETAARTSCVRNACVESAWQSDVTRCDKLQMLYGVRNTPWVKKHGAKVLFISSPDIERFSNFYHWQARLQIWNKLAIEIPRTPERCRYTTLWRTVQCQVFLTHGVKCWHMHVPVDALIQEYIHSFIHSFLYCNKCQTHSPLHMTKTYYDYVTR